MYSHKISLEVYTRLDMTILQQANETHLCNYKNVLQDLNIDDFL
jgi:hypothetical protein